MKIEVKNDDIPNDGISNDLTRNLDNSKNEFEKKCRRLSIKNIPAGSSHADIKSMFDKDKYPYNSIHIDKNIQSCKVIMKCGDDAMKFIEDHDGKPFTPRQPTQLLSVSFAPCDFMLFLTHMPLNFSSNDLKKLVATFGPVERSFLVHSAKTFKSLGMGCVEYTNKESSIRAKNSLNRKKIPHDNEEHTIQVHWLDQIPSEYCQLSSKVLMLENLEKHLDGEASLLKIMNDTNPNYLKATKDKDTNFAVMEYDTIDLAETAWENLNETTGLKVSICVPYAQGKVVFDSMENFVEAPGGGLLPLPDVPRVGNNAVPFTVAIPPHYAMIGDVNAQLQLMASMDMQRRPFYPQHLNSVLPPLPHILPPSHQPPPLLLPPPQQLQQQYYQQQLQQQQHTLTFGSSIPPQSKYYVGPYTQQQQQPYYQQQQQQQQQHQQQQQQRQQQQHQQQQRQQQQHQQQQRQQQQQYQQQKQQQQYQHVQKFAHQQQGYVPHHGRKDNGDGSLAQVNTEAQRSTNVRDYGGSGTSRPQCLSRSTSLTNELTKKDDTKSIWNTRSQVQSPTPYCSTNVSSSMCSSMENLNAEQDGIAVEPVGGHRREPPSMPRSTPWPSMAEEVNRRMQNDETRRMNESRNYGAIGTKMVPGEGYQSAYTPHVAEYPINQSLGTNSLNGMESSRVRTNTPTQEFEAYVLWPESRTWEPPGDLKTTSVAEEAVIDIEN